MKVICISVVLGICVLPALSASGELADSRAVETRTNAAQTALSCAMQKTFELKLGKKDRDQMNPVLWSVLSRVVRLGARRGLKYRLSGFDDGDLVRLSQKCGSMEVSELRMTLLLPERPGGEQALKAILGSRSANPVRRASASSGELLLSKRSLSHQEVSGRLWRGSVGMEKLERTISRTLQSSNEFRDLANNPTNEEKDPTTVIRKFVRGAGRQATNEEEESRLHYPLDELIRLIETDAELNKDMIRNILREIENLHFDADICIFIQNGICVRQEDLGFLEEDINFEGEGDDSDGKYDEMEEEDDGYGEQDNGLGGDSEDLCPVDPDLCEDPCDHDPQFCEDFCDHDPYGCDPCFYDPFCMGDDDPMYGDEPCPDEPFCMGEGMGDPHMTGFDGSEFMFKGDTIHVFDILSYRNYKLQAGLMMAESGRTYFNMFKVQSFNSTVQVLASTGGEPAQVIAGDHNFTRNEVVRVGKYLRVQVERWGQEQIHITIFTPHVVVKVTGHATVNFTQHFNLAVELTRHIKEPGGSLGSTLPGYEGTPASEMSPKQMIEKFGSLPTE